VPALARGCTRMEATWRLGSAWVVRRCDSAHYRCWALACAMPHGRSRAHLNWEVDPRLRGRDATCFLQTSPSRWTRSWSSRWCESMWQIQNMPQQGGKSFWYHEFESTLWLRSVSAGRQALRWLQEHVHVVPTCGALDLVNLAGVDPVFWR
jgi:hypothetical protein